MGEDYKRKTTKQLVNEYVRLSRICSNIVVNSVATDSDAWRNIHNLDTEKDLILKELERRTGEGQQ